MSDDRPRPTFSANELRASLGLPAMRVHDPDAMTVAEIAEQADVSEGTARRYIKTAIEQGAWISVGPQRRIRRNGAPFYVEGYKRAGADAEAAATS